MCFHFPAIFHFLYTRFSKSILALYTLYSVRILRMRIVSGKYGVMGGLVMEEREEKVQWTLCIYASDFILRNDYFRTIIYLDLPGI